MSFLNIFGKTISSSQRLFSKTTDEQQFLQQITRTHQSFQIHEDAMTKIEDEQNIEQIEMHLLNMVQEFTQFKKYCEKIRSDEIELFTQIKTLIIEEIQQIKEFLLSLVNDLPYAVSINKDMNSIIKVLQKTITAIEEAVLQLEQSFAQDMQNEKAFFSKQLQNSQFQETSLEQLETQRETLHSNLQSTLDTISSELEQLQQELKAHEVFSDNDLFTKIYEFRENIKKLSILIHERVGLSNLLILLSYEEEMKFANEIQQAVQKIGNLEQQLSSELKQSLQTSLNHLNETMQKVKGQSEKLRRVVNEQSQSFIYKLSKGFGLNFFSNGIYGMSKLGKFAYNNASEFKLTYKYLRRKIEVTGSKGINDFLKQHPEFREYFGAKIIIVQYSVFQNFQNKTPKWVTKFTSTSSNERDLKYVQRIIDKFRKTSNPQLLTAASSLLLAICISTIFAGTIATKINEEMI